MSSFLFSLRSLPDQLSLFFNLPYLLLSFLQSGLKIQYRLLFSGKTGLGYVQLLALILRLGFSVLQASLNAPALFLRLFELLRKFKVLLLEGPHGLLHLCPRLDLSFS